MKFHANTSPNSPIDTFNVTSVLYMHFIVNQYQPSRTSEHQYNSTVHPIRSFFDCGEKCVSFKHLDYFAHMPLYPIGMYSISITCQLTLFASNSRYRRNLF